MPLKTLSLISAFIFVALLLIPVRPRGDMRKKAWAYMAGFIISIAIFGLS